MRQSLRIFFSLTQKIIPKLSEIMLGSGIPKKNLSRILDQEVKKAPHPGFVTLGKSEMGFIAYEVR